MLGLLLTLISLLFIVLIISLIIVGIISFIAHAFKIKLSTKAIFVMIGLIAVSLVFIPIGFVTFYGSDYKDYKIHNEKKIVSCDNGGKISSAQYSTGGGDQTRNFLVYYQKHNKKVFLDHSLEIRSHISETSLLKQNPHFFNKGKDWLMGGFSTLDFMQKEQFDIINKENYLKARTAHAQNLEFMKKKNKMYAKRNFGSGGASYSYSNFTNTINPYSSSYNLNVTYINPEVVSRDEYIEILKCAKKVNIPDVLIYRRYKTGLPIDHEVGYPEEFSNSSEFDSFQCKDKKYTVNVFLNGLVVFNLAADTSYTADNFYNFPIGYLDTKANLIRDIEPYKRFVWEKKFNAKNLQEAGFAKAYKESEIVKLLFDQNQKPINNYLKNCRNKNKKTIFDAYRPEFKN